MEFLHEIQFDIYFNENSFIEGKVLVQGTCTCSTAKPCSFEAERSNHHFKDKAFSPPFVPLFTTRVFTMIF